MTRLISLFPDMWLFGTLYILISPHVHGLPSWGFCVALTASLAGFFGSAIGALRIFSQKSIAESLSCEESAAQSGDKNVFDEIPSSIEIEKLH